MLPLRLYSRAEYGPLPSKKENSVCNSVPFLKANTNPSSFLFFSKSKLFLVKEYQNSSKRLKLVTDK